MHTSQQLWYVWRCALFTPRLDVDERRNGPRRERRGSLPEKSTRRFNVCTRLINLRAAQEGGNVHSLLQMEDNQTADRDSGCKCYHQPGLSPRSDGRKFRFWRWERRFEIKPRRAESVGNYLTDMWISPFSFMSLKNYQSFRFHNSNSLFLGNIWRWNLFPDQFPQLLNLPNCLSASPSSNSHGIFTASPSFLLLWPDLIVNH